MDWKNFFKGGLTIVGAIIAVAAAIYGGLHYIDQRIETRISDESFVRRLANTMRPTVIFDERGSILIDQGAMELLENIEVKHDNTTKLPKEIVVFPKRHLAYAPFIQALEPELFTISAARGPRFVWVFRLDYSAWNPEAEGKRRFRMEIIP